jgi:uncharacterized protein
MPQETVLITGASSGIGRELAKCFAADGSRLALVARSGGLLESLADELRKLHKIDVRTFPVDLARPEAPAQVLSLLQTAGFKVDVLVNNAGFGAQGPVAEIALEQQLQMIQVNVTTLTHLTRLLLPGMIQRKRGGVLNVASTAAFQAGPYMAVYYATKAYVLSLSEALAEELRGTGVSVTALCPGPTKTNFATAAHMKPSALMKMSGMSAEEVARIGHRAFRRGTTVAITDLRNQLLAFSVRLVPRRVVRRIVGALNKAK